MIFVRVKEKVKIMTASLINGVLWLKVRVFEEILLCKNLLFEISTAFSKIKTPSKDLSLIFKSSR